MRIKPVILSGGSGTRLWPSSRKSLPKQFIDFPIIGSLFSRTLSRAAKISDAEQPLIISGKQHGFLCRQAASEAGIDAEFVLEEMGRNTAPAIYFAALASRPEDILLVMPSDHWIEDVDAFANMVTQAATICANARWVTFGIAPTMAATGYGYIEVAAREDGVMDVVSFTEKPDEATAKVFDLCRERGIWMILDETYRDFMPLDAGRPHDLIGRDGWRDTLIQLYSFSKSYCMPGHRLGAATKA